MQWIPLTKCIDDFEGDVERIAGQHIFSHLNQAFGRWKNIGYLVQNTAARIHNQFADIFNARWNCIGHFVYQIGACIANRFGNVVDVGHLIQNVGTCIHHRFARIDNARWHFVQNTGACILQRFANIFEAKPPTLNIVHKERTENETKHKEQLHVAQNTKLKRKLVLVSRFKKSKSNFNKRSQRVKYENRSVAKVQLVLPFYQHNYRVRCVCERRRIFSFSAVPNTYALQSLSPLAHASERISVLHDSLYASAQTNWVTKRIILFYCLIACDGRRQKTTKWYHEDKYLLRRRAMLNYSNQFSYFGAVNLAVSVCQVHCLAETQTY